MSLTSTASLQQAQARLMVRFDTILAECGARFPLFAAPAQPWQSSAGGSWMGGFWAGCWYLRAHLRGDAADLAQADAISARLADKIGLDSIHRSMLFWYGPGMAHRAATHGSAHPLLLPAASALAASWCSEMACLPVGPDLGGGPHGAQRIVVDSLAACISLLCASGEAVHAALARQHADTLLHALASPLSSPLSSTLSSPLANPLVTPNANSPAIPPAIPHGAWHTEARHDAGRFHAEGEAGSWSRGQAWAMLGLARAAREWGEPYLSHAIAANAYWQASRPAFPPPNHMLASASEVAGMPDPSAALIAALAQLALADMRPEADASALRQQAFEAVASLLQSDWFGSDPANATGAVFSGCCYQTRPGQWQLVETPWGNFLLLAALAMLQGQLSPHAI